MECKKFVYADNAATTRLSTDVLNKMMPYLTENYGNASSLYNFGNIARSAVDLARKQIADAICAEQNEIYFTAGGSESDNWAIKGIAATMRKKNKNHIISSAFEHHAVLHTLKALEKEGFEVTFLPVYENGIISIDDLKNSIREDTGLVTIMFANNEIGTIQPISQIGEICKDKKIIFHTDAVQAVGNIAIDVKSLNIDLLSMSAHKFHGPKGVGALFVRKGIFLPNLIHGGGQERSRRAGTENVAGIVGMGAAIEISCRNIEQKNKKLRAISQRVIDGALRIERSRLNGDPEKRLAGNVSLCFEGIEGESLLLMLDAMGVCASSGSACTSGSLDPSHVLLSIGLPHEIAHGSLRLSFSDENTLEDADKILEVLPGIVKRLRSISPLWDKIKQKEIKH
ncbi:MAG: cysteine desulfurase NifS [bacterium]|nr:cysteine desulfurase NifS [bacterium]